VSRPVDHGGLAGLHDTLAAHVAAGRLPGLTTLVARGDEVNVDTIGTASFGDAAPLRRDAVFRIASLTKPVVAVAALSLVDEGVLRLDEPIDDLVPELAGRRVLRSLDAELDDTLPAHRPITLEDVLTFRMGFGSIMAPPGTHPIQRAEEAVRLQSIGGPPWPPTRHDADSWMRALGSLPLMHQPGERWLYGTPAQVLGVIVGRATGQDLDAALRERVFDPLGMGDTGFTVPAGARDRLTTFYGSDPEGGPPVVVDDPADSWWSTPPSFCDAGGWLVSTIDDYWAFVSMVLAGGVGRGGERVLAPGTVAAMTADRLTPAQRAPVTLFLGDEGSWGLGLAVPAEGSAAPLPDGGIGWDGGTGTTWRSDLRRGVTGILFSQLATLSPEPAPLMRDFWAGLAAATAG
jgi:CubicO group peptidase (beta-lactamase class C family)